MKKIAALLLCFLLITPAGGCKAPENGVLNTLAPEIQTGTSLLSDKKFKNGFDVQGLGNPIYPEFAEEETFGSEKYGTVCLFQYGKSGLDHPGWDIAQWSTRYSFADDSVTSFSETENGVYRYQNPSKLLISDTNTGEITLGLKASECYVHGVREFGQEWPSMFLQRDTANRVSPSPFAKVSDKEKIVASVSVRLNSFTDNMGNTADPGLHAAQLLYYLYVSNRNPSTASFDDMIWLGIPIFDNRWAYTEQAGFVDSGTKGSATERYIYNLDSADYLYEGNNFRENGNIISGYNTGWVDVSVDVLPYIKGALKEAQNAGCMLESMYENLYISGMYIGFELPGNYDIETSLKGLDIRVY